MPAAAADTFSSDTWTAGYLAVAWLTACSSVSCAWAETVDRSIGMRRRKRNLLFPFNELAKQLPDFVFRCCQSLASGGCGSIDAAHGFSQPLRAGFQVSSPFQPVQQRIQRPQTQLVAVTGQFLGHSQPEDRLLHGVM